MIVTKKQIIAYKAQQKLGLMQDWQRESIIKAYEAGTPMTSDIAKEVVKREEIRKKTMARLNPPKHNWFYFNTMRGLKTLQPELIVEVTNIT